MRPQLWTPSAGLPPGARAQTWLREERARQRARWRHIYDPRLPEIRPWESAVSIVDESDAQISNSSTGSLDITTLNVSGSDRAIVAVIITDNLDVTFTADWDATGTPQALTLIPNAVQEAGTDKRVELWGRVAPTTGTLTLRIALSPGTHNLIIYAYALTGVDQTGGATSFPNGAGATNTNTTPSITVTSAVNDFTIGALAWISGTSSLPLQTQDFNETSLTVVNGTSSNAAGASTVTHGWTLSSQLWAMAGTSIKAVGGGGTTLTPAQAAAVLTGRGTSLGFGINMPDEP